MQAVVGYFIKPASRDVSVNAKQKPQKQEYKCHRHTASSVRAAVGVTGGWKTTNGVEMRMVVVTLNGRREDALTSFKPQYALYT